jgi:diguanylate cyclase (GGDEF)-like protein
MISLKRFIEAKPEESLKTMSESYRASLTAMGVSATQICPHIGEDFQRDLLNLRDRLSPEAAAETVTETGKLVEEELKKFGEGASNYFQQTATDVKEIMMIVAETAQAVGERDQRYARQFGEFSGQLAAIGNLEDLTKIRLSLGKSASQLKTYVEKMVQDGEQSVSKLRAELSVYQTRLDEVERVATQDPVTGVANRYKAERQLQLRIERGRSLSIAIFDLDNFKQTNDRYGHPAGDTLLKQFATELRTFFRASDIVSRWGGDEFLVIVDCSAEEVRDRIEPVRKWIDGDYGIKIGAETHTVGVRASAGMASWLPGETAAELIARADAAMYDEKTRRKKTAKAPAKEGVALKRPSAT